MHPRKKRAPYLPVLETVTQSRTQVSNGLIFLAQSKLPDARRAIAQAKNLSTNSASASLKIEIDIADARVQMAASRWAEANQLLEAGLGRARRLGLLGLQYEARLAKGELDRKSGRTAAGNAILGELQKDATGKGFKLIARRASIAASQN